MTTPDFIVQLASSSSGDRCSSLLVLYFAEYGKPLTQYGFY